MRRATPKPVPFALMLVTMLLAFARCAVNPATGERQLSFIGETGEIAMGREYDQQVVAQMGLYPDQALQQYIQQLGSRLAATSERPDLPWTFRVVDDPVVNAFALPGGFIYITRGILAHFQSEAELAAVLGHEIGHVTARHSVNQASKQQLAQIGLVVGMVLKPELQQYAGVASAGLGLLFLKYGRDDERQADDLGLRYMRRANYDGRRMPNVFSMLERVSQASGGGGTPEWLSTHPNPENRRERIERAITTLPTDSLGTLVNAESYLRRLDGLIFGQNPRDGFFRGSDFFQPDLAFRFTFPQGWTTQNQRNAVVGVSASEDALVQVTIAQEAGPASAARAFFAQEGVSGTPSASSINGLNAEGGDFAAAIEGGTLQGRVMFVSYGGNVYRLMAYAGEAGWPAQAATATAAIQSFQRLTDQTMLAVQPIRLDIITLDAPLTVAEFARRYASPVSAEVVALVNQRSADGRLPRGLAKGMEGQRLP
ncbi:MAG TPA: M48 family metalloprotease [Gemmatimonadales bacterium]